MIRLPPRSTLDRSSAASDVYKRQALFDVQYPAPGDPALAAETKKIISSTNVGLDHDLSLIHISEPTRPY